MTVDAYIGLGANLGDRAAAIAAAVARLGARPWVRAARRSRLYETAPVGPVRDQPPFLNAVVELSVEGIDAPALLDELRALESALGRTPRAPQGPREIDLDLLLFGNARIDTSDLTVPHPRLTERAFALRPLADLLGSEAPVLGRPLRQWLASPAVVGQDIEPWDA